MSNLFTHEGKYKLQTVSASFALLSVMLLLGVLLSRSVSFWVVGKSDPEEWREFFICGTGVAWTFGLLCVGACGAIAGGIQLARKENGMKSLVALGLTAAAILSSALILLDIVIPATSVAEVPGMVVRAMPSPPVVLPKLGKGFSVYFSNGDSQVKDLFIVRQLLNAARSCGANAIEVTGYSSSAPYAKNNEENNVQLANERAANVSALAVSGLTPIEHRWQVADFTTMLLERGYSDQINGSRATDVEILNRRVDVSFECKN